MDPSLAIVPTANNSTQVTIADTANKLGLHDAMRYGTRSLASDVAPKHSLELRLNQWDETQENLQLTLQRNLYGLHAPIRQLMERQIVSQTSIPGGFGQGFSRPSNISLDILLGKDETIEIADVLTDGIVTAELGDFHVMMEKKLRMM